MKRVVLDIETDAIDATVVHCIVAQDLDTGAVDTWYGESIKDFPAWSESVGSCGAVCSEVLSGCCQRNRGIGQLAYGYIGVGPCDTVARREVAQWCEEASPRAAAKAIIIALGKHLS